VNNRKVALGRLTPMAARDVWPMEARDFTPWLLDNADALGEVLGMDLALSGAEHRVGGYALDLIGKDEATGDAVIVENQLEASNHTHLGQILTYAGGTDPVNIVWVATQFREEHRAALEWLNERTNERTRFFAVTVSVVRIEDSVPAPLFSLVVQPNDWGKQVRATTSTSASASARVAAYREFWSKFLERVQRDHPRWTYARTPPAQNWMNLPTGRSDVLYGVTFGKKGLGSELYFGGPDSAANAEHFQALLSCREAFEDSYGYPLDWDALPGKKAARIAEYTPGSIERVEDWATYVDWFVDRQDRLRRAIADLGGLHQMISQGELSSE
jgi:Domain of unknown function (DUF4268)